MKKVVFFEAQLKAKCYRMLFLRLARLGGKTYGGSPLLPEGSPCPRSRPEKTLLTSVRPEQMTSKSGGKGLQMQPQND